MHVYRFRHVDISIIIKFLNRINKFIWKIIIFLSQFIKVDEINHLDDKPQDVKYRLFNVDEPAIIEPFVSIEHKDYKQLIKDNNIKQPGISTNPGFLNV